MGFRISVFKNHCFYIKYEKRPSKTHGKINISKCILGAVVKKSDTTTVIYGVFENPPSKTHSKIAILKLKYLKKLNAFTYCTT